jgi:hypothetical protein
VGKGDGRNNGRGKREKFKGEIEKSKEVKRDWENKEKEKRTQKKGKRNKRMEGKRKIVEDGG